MQRSKSNLSLETNGFVVIGSNAMDSIPNFDKILDRSPDPDQLNNHPHVNVVDYLVSDETTSSLTDKVHGTSRVVAIPYAKVRDNLERTGIAYRWNNGDTSFLWSA